MTEKALTQVMRHAMKTMQNNGGKLIRLAGGYWVVEGHTFPNYGTSTIEALVSRGVAEYTEWKDSYRGGINNKFPIEVSLVASQPAHYIGKE